jgi:stearoyl-CoA desaturase (delta-9 desaturase)
MYSLLIVWYVFIALGVSLGTHRLISHNSFQSNSVLKYLLVYAGTPAGPPIQWALNHRIHHKTTDTADDPHSPYFGGFWHAHCGWYLPTSSTIVAILYAIAGPIRTIIDPFIWKTFPEKLPKDLDDPLLKFMSRRPVNFILALSHLLPFYFLYVELGWFGIALAWLIAVLFYNLGDSINSVSHLVGSRDDPNTEARNFLPSAMLTMGEGNHAEHHQTPGNANFGGFDIGYLFLRIMKLIRMVKLKPHQD